MATEPDSTSPPTEAETKTTLIGDAKKPATTSAEASRETPALTSTVSVVHRYLETYCLGDARLQMQVDNCSGKNKNIHFHHLSKIED